MSTIINVDGLEFTFSEEWSALAYDETPEHRRNPNQDIIANAVDLVAARSGTGICFIEVKDYRTNPGQDRAKLMDGSLETKVAKKVRDTIAGTVGFSKTSSVPQRFTPLAAALSAQDTALKIVLWIESDLRFLSQHRQKQRASTFEKRLKQRLSWATNRVLVCNRDIVTAILPGITVRDTPTT